MVVHLYKYFTLKVSSSKDNVLDNET